MAFLPSPGTSWKAQPPPPFSLPLLRFPGGGQERGNNRQFGIVVVVFCLSRTSKLTALAPWDFYALGAGRRVSFLFSGSSFPPQATKQIPETTGVVRQQPWHWGALEQQQQKIHSPFPIIDSHTPRTNPSRETIIRRDLLGSLFGRPWKQVDGFGMFLPCA